MEWASAEHTDLLFGGKGGLPSLIKCLNLSIAVA